MLGRKQMAREVGVRNHFAVVHPRLWQATHSSGRKSSSRTNFSHARGPNEERSRPARDSGPRVRVLEDLRRDRDYW